MTMDTHPLAKIGGCQALYRPPKLELGGAPGGIQTPQAGIGGCWGLDSPPG